MSKDTDTLKWLKILIPIHGRGFLLIQDIDTDADTNTNTGCWYLYWYLYKYWYQLDTAKCIDVILECSVEVIYEVIHIDTDTVTNNHNNTTLTFEYLYR